MESISGFPAMPPQPPDRSRPPTYRTKLWSGVVLLIAGAVTCIWMIAFYPKGIKGHPEDGANLGAGLYIVFFGLPLIIAGGVLLGYGLTTRQRVQRR